MRVSNDDPAQRVSDKKLKSRNDVTQWFGCVSQICLHCPLTPICRCQWEAINHKLLCPQKVRRLGVWRKRKRRGFMCVLKEQLPTDRVADMTPPTVISRHLVLRPRIQTVTQVQFAMKFMVSKATGSVYVLFQPSPSLSFCTLYPSVSVPSFYPPLYLLPSLLQFLSILR